MTGDPDKPLTDLLGLAAQGDGALYTVDGPFAPLAVRAQREGWLAIVPVSFRIALTEDGKRELARRRGTPA